MHGIELSAMCSGLEIVMDIENQGNVAKIVGSDEDLVADVEMGVDRITPRRVNDFGAVTIRGGKIYGLTLSYHFNVKLAEDKNPAVCPRVNCDGMPVEMLCKKAWDAMKVSGRPSMKRLEEKVLLAEYHNKEIEWQMMVSQEFANNHISTNSLDNEQLEREIARLEELRAGRKG